MPTKQSDLDALADAFAGVRPLGQPSAGVPRGGVPGGGGSPPRGAPTAAQSARASHAAPSPSPSRPGSPPPPAPTPSEDDAAALREALRGVRRLDPPPAGPTRPLVAPVPSSLTPPSSELLRHLERENEVLTARVTGLLLEREAARISALGAVAEATAATARVEEISSRLRELEAEGRTLRDRASERSTGEFRTLLVERGLRSEAEMAAALTALLDGGRFLPLLCGMVVARRAELLAFLEERLILLAEGEEAPAGRAVVRVPSERSEAREDSALRAALAQFSSACLVGGKRRVVFVGGSPAYRKQLREGLDRRLDLRFVEGNQVRIPKIDADLVIVWGATELDHSVSNHFPGAMLVPHRGIVGMLQMASQRLGA